MVKNKAETQEELEIMENKTAEELWNDDLDEFLEHYREEDLDTPPFYLHMSDDDSDSESDSDSDNEPSNVARVTRSKRSTLANPLPGTSFGHGIDDEAL